MNYEMISGDAHIDLARQPPDLFAANAFGPDSKEITGENLGQLEERVRRKVVCENAGRLYGFLN